MPDDVLGGEAAALRARLVALVGAHARGEIDDVAYEAARRDIDRALGDALIAAPIAPSAPATARGVRPSKRLAATLALVVLVVAIAGYSFTGSPSLISAPAPAPATAQAPDDGGERAIGLQQIAAMVDKLAARLKDRPNDAEGWMMLARSYSVLSRYADAVPAYERAVALQPGNGALLADYADAVAATNDGKQNAESLALIERALAVDPKQPKALALSGTVAFDRGDYATAASQWQKIADVLPPDSEFHRQVEANIDEARRRGGLAKAPSTVPAAAPGREALTGIVTLDPALAARAAPGDTVFVLARPESGRMPLAVFRATVKDLPLRFRLDDSMAMTSTMKLSDMKEVVVVARVSKSGNAISQPGDLAGESAPVAPGTHDLSIVVSTVIPPK